MRALLPRSIFDVGFAHRDATMASKKKGPIEYLPPLMSLNGSGALPCSAGVFTARPEMVKNLRTIS